MPCVRTRHVHVHAWSMYMIPDISLRLAISFLTLCRYRQNTEIHRQTETQSQYSIGATRVIQGNIDLMSTVVTCKAHIIESCRARVAAFIAIGRQNDRAWQHAAATHGRQGQSRVYSSTLVLYQPSYKIDRNIVGIACGISDVWAGSMYWLSSKWSEQIRYELYNCFAVFEPRSHRLVFITHFFIMMLQQERRWCKYCFAHFSTK